jgi:RNA polymerase sigma-70 factor (ECF subfamily)
LTGNAADAADATQESLVAVVRGLPRFDGRAAFTTWSYRIAANACLDELRRPTLGIEGHEPSDDATIEDEVIADVSVHAALQQLPLDFRAAVVLRDLCGLDYAEIAEVLAVPPGTVRSRIARGRALLADRIGGNRPPGSDRPTPEP